MSLTLAERIKEQTKELGFQLVGIAPAVPSEHGAFFAVWLERGYAGDMDYMARNIERRLNILETMPEARSVLVVGWNYYQPADEPVADGSRGRIARYARGKDYHKILESRLKQILAFVRQESGRKVKAKIYVDAGPVLEREIGSLAGIGWFGKNTMLIHPRLGSWFLLGELVLDIELDYDPPFRFDYCGSCNRCLEACPTGAIRAPRLVDSTLCISYLTIELRGPIPHELRSQMGNWVFGCDICQEVCPWNKKFARPT